MVIGCHNYGVVWYRKNCLNLDLSSHNISGDKAKVMMKPNKDTSVRKWIGAWRLAKISVTKSRNVARKSSSVTSGVSIEKFAFFCVNTPSSALRFFSRAIHPLGRMSSRILAMRRFHFYHWPPLCPFQNRFVEPLSSRIRRWVFVGPLVKQYYEIRQCRVFTYLGKWRLFGILSLKASEWMAS